MIVGRTLTIQGAIKKEKEINKCTNHYKVRRSITKWGAIEKSPILPSQYWEKKQFFSAPKIISYFGGTNNIPIDSVTIQSWISILSN